MIGDLSNLYRPSEAESRSLSAENPTGVVGGGARAALEASLHPDSARAARELGPGWKVSPCIEIAAGDAAVLMDHDGPGVIRHIWITARPQSLRDLVVRMYWDGQEQPSVACPLGDLFCCAWGEATQINALPINVNSIRGMNSYFPMPFRRHARITVHNDSPHDLPHLFYTIDYTLEDVPDDAMCFHAQWRRSNPLGERTDHVILDGVQGAGKYLGTFAAWQQNNSGWWGEGEFKAYLDDDASHPTICGTGTEDYFGGAWCFEGGDYSAPFCGFRCLQGRSGQVGARMIMYRFHVPDPIHFRRALRVTLQALGWRSDHRYLALRDDIATVAYWYQSLPTAPFPALPDRNAREIV